MFGFFYDIAVHLFVLWNLPRIFFNWKKYSGILGARLGIGFPKIEKGERKLIWVHAVSMGETRAVLPLIKKLKAVPNSPLVILSTVTKTGHEEGKKGLADWAVYLPFDFRYIIRPIMRRIRPDLVILTETDFWYHFQDAAKNEGAQLVVVNAKISERSYCRYKKFPFFVRHLLNPVDHFYVQGPLYEERLRNLGIADSKIEVTGNIKLDADVDLPKGPTKEQLGLSDKYVITLGSTHAPEERLWIEALKKLWHTHANIKVLIVPRHPERFNEVANLLEQAGLDYARWSQKGTLFGRDVLLVDAMGVLKTCYQLSDLAFVGGSFTPQVGGHNILEPSFYGKPVVFGPYLHSQPDLLDLMRSYQAGLQIMPEDIVSTVNQLMESSALSSNLGKNGLKLVSESRGALEKTFHSLQPLLEKKGS